MTTTTDRVRVLTLNLDANPDTWPQRRPAVAALCADLQPDIICLQEVRHAADGTSTADQVAALTGIPVAGQARHDRHPGGAFDGVAILSTLPVTGVHVRDLTDAIYLRRAVAVELTAPSGRGVVAMSAHLAWGGSAEASRLAEAAILDEWAGQLRAEDPSSVAVLGVDLNTVPGSATLRYLTGLEPYAAGGAYWVDSWSYAGDGGPGHTSCSSNPWAARTAAMVGITRPDLIPDRRIDYLLVRGWAYGRPGSPLAARVVGTPDRDRVVPSDHYGVLVDLWDPHPDQVAPPGTFPAAD